MSSTDDSSNSSIDYSNSDNDSIENDEILLHYTKLRSNYLNVAWRTIKWDLFKDYVPK